MGIGILVATLALLFGVQSATDITAKDNQLVPGYEIEAEELEALRESMEPELFEGVIYYYATQDDVEPAIVDTSVSPLKNLYVQKGMNVRNKPGIHGKVVGLLAIGDEVSVYQENGEWTYIKNNTTEGYVSSKSLAETKPAPIVPAEKPEAKSTVKPQSSSASNSSRVGASVVEGGTYETEMTFNLSFYTNRLKDNGGYSRTASGKLPAYGMVANNKLPIGTKIYLEGWGVFTVEDRGGSHFNSINRIDIFIPPNKGETEKEYVARLYKLGRQSVRGTILN